MSLSNNLLMAAVMLLGMPPRAFADGTPAPSYIPSANYQMNVGLMDCLSETGDDIEAKRACYKVPMELADEALARALGEFMASRISDKAKIELSEVQKEWERFRDADCNLWGTLPLNNIAWPFLSREFCYMQHTIKRANELGTAKIMHLPIKRLDK